VPTNFILAVNGVKTSNLDTFLEEVSKIPDNTCKLYKSCSLYENLLTICDILLDFRLRVITFDNIPFVITIKKNEHYVSRAQVSYAYIAYTNLNSFRPLNL